MYKLASRSLAAAAARSKATRTTTTGLARKSNSICIFLTASNRDHHNEIVSFSTYSSFAEPDPTLFAKYNNNTTTYVVEDNKNNNTDAQLRADIRVMGSVLGMVIRKHEGVEIFDKVEQMRSLAKAWREAAAAAAPVDDNNNNNMNNHNKKEDENSSFAQLAAFAAQLSNHELFLVSRAFTHFLAIANAAEGHHRTRRLKQATWPTTDKNKNNEQQYNNKSCGALYPKPDSCGGVLPALVAAGHHSKDAIWQALATQTTELVLTAHPTEVNRRTILEKKRRIQKILTVADAYRAVGHQTEYDLQLLDHAMQREIGNIWLSDEVSRTKPTPVQEAEKGTLVLETVLWEAVPEFLRKLDATANEFLGQGLPLTAAPVRFASWMGGDRDGNPNVQPNTTRQVCLNNRRKAATLFYKDLQKLESELSITTCSDELRAVVGDAAREPYRALIRPMLQKLLKTQHWAEQELEYLLLHEQQQQRETTTRTAATVASAHHHHHIAAIAESEAYLSKDEFTEALLLLHRSLCDTGNEMAADGILTDILRNVAAFGLTLIPLDVRQESDRHEEAMDAITRFLGLGSYAQWDEETKISWLTSQISSRRPLIRSGVWKDHPDVFSPTAVDTLEIFQMIADQHEGSLGAYVISQATSASDVLAVLLLQSDAGVKKPLRVAPLFETLDDLNGAAATMKKLFSLPVYMGIINGKQEVMIGYSDSAKDAGR